jgi:hypothetical protein
MWDNLTKRIIIIKYNTYEGECLVIVWAMLASIGVISSHFGNDY